MGKTEEVIDLSKNGTYIVKDGKLLLVPSPPAGFGKQVINWQGGKPCNGTIEESVKF
ncbi:hypothetical protein NCCP2716_27630 [Sporosarcina sp. NCCP-2716]|uniref:DUF3954 domain-containing protein n=1 Tax=Sporosarcina sp. NCCP-2716 TaxID=2943679 RepID=UPI00203F1BC4|nr:DUF3954 domain-containing protein [Sporosarcina sp. NCCP-2716]GKV70265.1 hypothetical protein NCCP2716_27630 [Sporosarcina sp. NCCP-2716]